MCRIEQLQQQRHADSRSATHTKKQIRKQNSHGIFALDCYFFIFFPRICGASNAFTSLHVEKKMCHVLAYGCHWLAAHRPANLKCRSNEMTTHIASFIEIYYPLGCIKSLMFLIASQPCFFAGIFLLLPILLGELCILGGPTNSMLAL